MIVGSKEYLPADAGTGACVMMAGVGGQGVTLAADILAEAATLSGLEPRLTEIYGVGRQQGSVRCRVRLMGAAQPLWESEAADYLLAMEMKEGFELLSHLKSKGLALVNRLWLGSAAAAGELSRQRMAVLDPRIVWIDGTRAVEQSSAEKSLHLYLLGTLSRHLQISRAAWQEALLRHLPPKQLQAGLEVFRCGASLPVATPGELETAGV